MTLQLADGNKMMYRTLSDGISDNYLTMPNPEGDGLIQVRADVFDDLPNDQWLAMMEELAPYNVGVSGLFSKMIARHQENKAKRQETKAAKGEQKTQRQAQRQAALMNIAGSIFGGGASGGGDSAGDTGYPMPTPDQRGFQVNYGTPPPVEEKKWYQNPLVIVGGAALVGTGIYLATRKKR
jgi:hypothetical protein